MRFPWTISLILATNLSFGKVAIETEKNYSFNMEEIQNRIEAMDFLFEVQNNFRVEKHLEDYLVLGQKQSAYILKRSSMYLPLFEHYLEAYDLPDMLKYLPIVESRMKATEFSDAGAKGLWQLIPATARENGLIVNDQIDERMDPYKSTEAAVKFLKSLYDQYEDWSLVLAAYNCGPGKVNKAIKASGACGSFWTVQNYLPGQTKNYIPKFIAASYMAEFHLFHGIEPNKLDYDLQFTTAIRVFNTVNLSKVSKITGLPMSTIVKLNPSYIKGYIPANKYGSFLILPKMSMIRLTDYIKWKDDSGILTDMNHLIPNLDEQLKDDQEAIYVFSDKSLDDLAKEYQLNVSDIKNWNKTKKNVSYPGQRVLLILPKDIANAIGERA